MTQKAVQASEDPAARQAYGAHGRKSQAVPLTEQKSETMRRISGLAHRAGGWGTLPGALWGEGKTCPYGVESECCQKQRSSACGVLPESSPKHDTYQSPKQKTRAYVEQP